MALVIPATRTIVVGAAALLAACGGRPAATVPAPSAPEATVAQFIAAANANDLERMAALWGTERGPSTATNPNSPAVQRQQLQIMQRLLVCDEHRVTGAQTLVGEVERRQLMVELVRNGRRANVPFTLVQARTGGWLISEIGLDAAMVLARPAGS